MNVAIVGYGEQGKSAFNYFNNLKNTVTICDISTEAGIPEGALSQLGAGYLANLNKFDLIVRSPGVHPQDIANSNQDNPDILSKVTTNTNEFFKVCPAPIIGVTGTKGKGTTSSLIANILQAAGKTVHLGGNIGIPPLDLLKNNIKEDDYVVLEIANFQLIDLKQSPHVAVCLMIVEEHLDWHKNMYEYVTAKQQIFAHQSQSDIAIFNARNAYATEITTASKAQIKIGYDVPPVEQSPQYINGCYVEGNHIKMNGRTVCHIKDVKLRGRHNLENVCAAISAVWELVDHDTKPIKQAISTFTGLPHRLEEVRQFQGVSYIDDSFGTTPQTAIVAMQAYKEPKIMIVGGTDKGVPFDELAEEISKSNIRHIIAIGETGPAILGLVKKYESGKKISSSIIQPPQTMEDVVLLASQVARAGDVVLLSTGCASFDMFNNYKDRGEQFKRAVLSLG